MIPVGRASARHRSRSAFGTLSGDCPNFAESSEENGTVPLSAQGLYEANAAAGHISQSAASASHASSAMQLSASTSPAVVLPSSADSSAKVDAELLEVLAVEYSTSDSVNELLRAAAQLEPRGGKSVQFVFATFSNDSLAATPVSDTRRPNNRDDARLLLLDADRPAERPAAVGVYASAAA